jgi:hypothetical protein
MILRINAWKAESWAQRNAMTLRLLGNEPVNTSPLHTQQ